jgi:hypothetical protein
MGLKDQEETSRVGTKWLPEEDAKLIEEISTNISYDDIALEHKRTSTGIKSRVISQIIYPIFKEGNKTIDEISLEYKIDKEIIDKYINKLETNNAIQKSIDKNNSDDTHNKTKIPKIKRNNVYEKIISFEKRFEKIENKLEHIISLLT